MSEMAKRWERQHMLWRLMDWDWDDPSDTARWRNPIWARGHA